MRPKSFRVVPLGRSSPSSARSPLIPLYVMVTSSLKPLRDVQGDFHWLPTHLTLQPFIDIWSTVPLARYFANSLVVCTVATVFSVVIAIFAAYADLAATRSAAARCSPAAVLSTQMFPGILFLLPLFLIFVNIDKQLGFTLLYQTRAGLILTYLTFSLPFSIWMLVGYLDWIPRDLDEAARVDGTRPLGALFRVVLPAARAGHRRGRRLRLHDAWGEMLFASHDDQRGQPDAADRPAELLHPDQRVLEPGDGGLAGGQRARSSSASCCCRRYLVAGLTAGAVK